MNSDNDKKQKNRSEKRAEKRPAKGGSPHMKTEMERRWR
jgi:hypothetical protein